MPRRIKITDAEETDTLAMGEPPATSKLRAKASTVPTMKNVDAEPMGTLKKKEAGKAAAAVESPTPVARATKTGRVQKKKAPATKRPTTKKSLAAQTATYDLTPSTTASEGSDAPQSNIDMEVEYPRSDIVGMEDDETSDVEEVTNPNIVAEPDAHDAAAEGGENGGDCFGLRMGGGAPPPPPPVPVDPEQAGTQRGNIWQYRWRNPNTLFPQTVRTTGQHVPRNVPKIEEVDPTALRLDRSLNDTIGEVEYIAKQPYDMLWKAILEPARANFLFTGYEQWLNLPQNATIAVPFPTARFDRGGHLRADHRQILRIHDDFARRCTVRIGMGLRRAEIDTILRENGRRGGGGGGGGGTTYLMGGVVPPGEYPAYLQTRETYFTYDENEPVIDPNDYAPNPARLILPMTTFTEDHPLLVTDRTFNPGADYDDEDITIESWDQAVEEFLAEQITLGYPCTFDDGTEDQTISGANGRLARIRWRSSQKSGWSFSAGDDDPVCTLRGNGVPWGGGYGEDGSMLGLPSCAIDAVIMLGRFLGVLHRQGDKNDPNNMDRTWEDYLGGLTGPQRLFRKLVARDWDRTPKKIGYEMKAQFWEGAILEDSTAGLEDDELDQFFERYDRYDFEMMRRILRATKNVDPATGGSGGPDPWDDPNYDPDQRNRAERMQRFREQQRAARLTTQVNFDDNLDPCLIWSYVFGSHGTSLAHRSPVPYMSHIYKQCWNFNIHFRNRVLYCRTCNRLFHATTHNKIPQEESDLNKPYFENQPYEDWRSYVTVDHSPADAGWEMWKRIQNNFWSSGQGKGFETDGGAAGNVCLDCVPGWTPTLVPTVNPETGAQEMRSYQHPDSRTAPCAIDEIIGEMPKQLVVHSSYYDEGDHPIRDMFSQNITFETIRETENPPAGANGRRYGERQRHTYRFVGGVFVNYWGAYSAGHHFRVYMKESADTYRRYDGQQPQSNRGMTLGDIEDEPENENGIFCDVEYGFYPVISIYERVDDPVDPPAPGPTPAALSSVQLPAIPIPKGNKRAGGAFETAAKRQKKY